MHANLDGYFRAELANRQRLSDRAARGWLSEEAAATRRPSLPHATLRRATGALLVRAGTRLQGLPRPETAPPLAALGGTGS